ncbi:MAG: hypothetical protein V1790_19795 [Planctomycetota bacterium]
MSEIAIKPEGVRLTLIYPLSLHETIWEVYCLDISENAESTFGGSGGGWTRVVSDLVLTGRVSTVWFDPRPPQGESATLAARFYALGLASANVYRDGVSEGRGTLMDEAARGHAVLEWSVSPSEGGAQYGGSSVEPFGTCDEGTSLWEENARLGARVIYVDASVGSDDYDGLEILPRAGRGPKRSVRAGLEVARNGDTVELAEGVYRETDGPFQGFCGVLVRTRGRVTVRSGP